MSGRQIIGFVVGLAIAATIIAFGTIYVIDTLLAPRDPNDPLTRQGGLRPEQDIHKK